MPFQKFFRAAAKFGRNFGFGYRQYFRVNSNTQSNLRIMAAEMNVVLPVPNVIPENHLDEKPIFGGDDNANFSDGKLFGKSKLDAAGEADGKSATDEHDDFEEEVDDGDESEGQEQNEDFISYLQALRGRRPKTPNVPSTVTVLTHRCDHQGAHQSTVSKDGDLILGHVYLIGTAHFSLESQSDVRLTIRETQPDIVMVELCPSRIAVLALNEATLLEEARSLTTDKMLKIIREAGFVQGVMHILLLSMSAHITRQLGMAPGGEFRVAFQEAQNVPGCRWHLGDRLIQTTMARALGTLSVWQKMRLFWSIIWSHNIQITKEEVEKCKQRDLLEELLREMAGEFPELSRIFVDERDQYMAHTLFSLLHHAAAKRREQMSANDPWEPVVIVGVVGMGHVPGIVANFGKDIDVQKLLQTPKPSRWARCAKVAIKGAFVGATAYIAYRSALYAYRLFIR